MILLLILFLGSCGKKNPYPIPNYYTVNINIDLNGFDNDLSIGSVKTFNNNRYSAGYRGVVVYRNGLDEFCAYDMACPNDHYSGCTIIDDTIVSRPAPSDLCLSCRYCCNCKFSLLDGSPQSSGCKYPLQRYQVTKINDHKFLIHN